MELSVLLKFYPRTCTCLRERQVLAGDDETSPSIHHTYGLYVCDHNKWPALPRILQEAATPIVAFLAISRHGNAPMLIVRKLIRSTRTCCGLDSGAESHGNIHVHDYSNSVPSHSLPPPPYTTRCAS